MTERPCPRPRTCDFIRDRQGSRFPSRIESTSFLPTPALVSFRLASLLPPHASLLAPPCRGEIASSCSESNLRQSF